MILFDRFSVKFRFLLILESILKPSRLETYTVIDQIRHPTRVLAVFLTCNAISSSDQLCFFDQIHFSVFR